MKVISFFSAKGGTGKTTFNVLLASYIKYRLDKRVMVLDFDYPEYNLSYMRRRAGEDGPPGAGRSLRRVLHIHCRTVRGDDCNNQVNSLSDG